MTTTDSSVNVEALALAAQKQSAYAETLRNLAEAIDAGAIPTPRTPLRIYLSSYNDEDPRATFRATRSAFPNAPVLVDPDGYGYVEIALNDTARLLFDKKTLGTTTTVTRPVEEFTIDSELLGPVPCRDCGRALHTDDPSNTGFGHHVDCTADGALAGQPT